jgi:cysteine peptidase C11 family protein
MKQVGSTTDINVVAEVDRAGATLTTKRFFLRPGGKASEDVVQDLGETNTGDPKVLESFLDWSVAQNPAEHYLLVLWNHEAKGRISELLAVRASDRGKATERQEDRRQVSGMCSHLCREHPRRG